MDEIGSMIGFGDNPLVISLSEVSKIFTVDTGKRGWVSIMEAMNVAGRALDPLDIFKASHVQQQWFKAQVQGKDFRELVF